MVYQSGGGNGEREVNYMQGISQEKPGAVPVPSRTGHRPWRENGFHGPLSAQGCEEFFSVRLLISGVNRPNLLGMPTPVPTPSVLSLRPSAGFLTPSDDWIVGI